MFVLKVQLGLQRFHVPEKTLAVSASVDRTLHLREQGKQTFHAGGIRVCQRRLLMSNLQEKQLYIFFCVAAWHGNWEKHDIVRF